MKTYNSGIGGDLRADIVWGALSTTTLEMGYREFPIGGAWPDLVFSLHRFGFIQRFYPMLGRTKNNPYLGLGLTASNTDKFSLNVSSADYGGWVMVVGVEIPLTERLRIDPAIRWDFWVSTDYFYSGYGLNVHLIWSPGR